MNILALSTSSKCPSAAVSRGGDIIAFIKDESGRSHSAVLMELIECVLAEAEMDKTEIDAIAVDVGPGSFTGVRIGVSCANAMAFSLGVGVIPVCSLAAMRNKVSDGGTVAAIIDCRNGNCYAAVFMDGETAAEPCPAVTEEIIASLPENAVIVGDCLGRRDYPDAKLVLAEALRGKTEPRPEAVPMYLRPSQAERMKNK